MIFLQALGAGSGGTILSSPLFIEVILPFLLVFTVVFALLQKTQILGKGKRQIDAIVSLVVGLIVVSFGFATGVIISLIPFLAVSAVIILVFLLLYGMVFKEGEFKVNKGIQVTVGIIVAIAVVVAVMVATGAWDYLTDLLLYSGDSSAIFTNAIFFVVIIVAIVIVLVPWRGGKEDK